MMKQKVMELGNFVGDWEGTQEENFAALQQTLREGMILPSAWQIVDEDGNPDSALDDLFGCCEFISFMEIPEDAQALPRLSGYGIGFTSAFLEEQGVEPVNYISVDPDEIKSTIIDMWENMDNDSFLEMTESAQHFHRVARTAIDNVRRDPIKRAMLREVILNYANDKRTYYEIVPVTGDEEAEQDAINEWRGVAPVQFTLADIQSIYVSSPEDVSTLRVLFPEYDGTFIILGA